MKLKILKRYVIKKKIVLIAIFANGQKLLYTKYYNNFRYL